MKRFAVAGAICAAFLFAAMLPVYAQDEHHDDDKDQPRQEEHHDQDKQNMEKHDANVKRIDDAHFRQHFGSGHHFAIKHVEVVGGHPHFAYGGYNFEVVQAWPAGWAYTDQCYIDFIDGEYFLFDLAHPGVRVAVVVL
ncbi:MAG TPA: hypothetical protein VMD76_02625 [Candidatus Sulfotelmatobacter sp.]|nr:hypothetical protein [Candidatus Sulfotelmatobacter sp.]